MEGVVAKRCLRQSSILVNNNKSQTRSAKESYSNIYRKNLYISNKINKDEVKNKTWIEKVLFNIKLKLWMQTVGAMCLGILLIVIDLLNINYINSNKYVQKLKIEYGKNYSISDIKNKGIEIVKYSSKAIIKIIPNKVQNKIKSIYVDFKENFGDKENENIVVYEEKIEEKKEKDTEISKESQNQGVGVSIIETEQVEEKEETIAAVSAISSEDNELKYIKDNNIKFVSPTKGTITSNFGAREVIFADIDPYHTGIDIANKKGTDILASTDGIVTKATYNKYNGNFIEITNGKVITKYAHMDSLSVKTGAKVNAGDIIGKMGETGYATGPHLHFEVVVDSVKINPAKVVKF